MICVNVVSFSLLNGHRFITIMLASYDTLHLAKYYLTFQHVYACHVGNITSGLWFSQNYYYFWLVPFNHFFSFLFHELLEYLKYYSVWLSMVPLRCGTRIINLYVQIITITEWMDGVDEITNVGVGGLCSFKYNFFFIHFITTF